jgi:hypothetical protein
MPNSHVEYTAPDGDWDTKHYNKYYEEKVKPVFDIIRDKVNQIQREQQGEFHTTISILWNKCRYFEMTAPHTKEARRFVAQSAKIKLKYNSMFVGGKDKLQAVVIACNKMGYYCNIRQDWI